MVKPKVSVEHCSKPTGASAGEARHPMPQANERPVRIMVHEHCTIARQNGGLEAGVLLNLSDQGFSVHTRHRPEVGERIEVQVPGWGRVSGIVRWTNGTRSGGVLEPFTSGAFDNTQD